MISCNPEIASNFEILKETLVDDGHGCDYDKRSGSSDLRSVAEIPHAYQQVFSEFSSFNVIQSKVMDDVLFTDESLVISAPTGSGKTVIFELAILRLLISLEHTQYVNPFKIVYICPMKALCEERLVDWHKKFSNFGINAIAVTGDSENIEFRNLLNHNLIITTPEKWDCLTRKWRENIGLVQMIKLFMIDEIHLLNEEARGSTLETIVCRMKTIKNSVDIEKIDDRSMRFVAVSATIPNVEDVAEWLETSKCHKFSHEYRPVKLNKIVLGYSQLPNTSFFKFDMSLNYKLHSLIMQYSHGKPTLIFCGTRKIVEMTAKHILDNLTINLKPEQLKCLVDAAECISDSKVKNTLVHGVGYHHAGMLPHTRRVVENLFRNGDLPILVTTSTLAMGVNLPAHLVIIKSTKLYSNGGFRDYTETTLLQMIGRAGRPQYDTEATALILTSSKDKEKFEKMIGGLQPIESDLHRHLIEHLNAEVVLQTITDLNVALRWLSSTFLYIRARKNPRYYGLTSSDPSWIDRRLLEMCQIELNKLIKAGMLTLDQDVLLKATSVGSAMARYYLAFETMKLFTQITGGEILQQILGLISKCFEFSNMYLRVNDKKCLNLLNKCRSGQTIRFPLSGKIKTLDMKINCIIQAVLGCLDICDHSILTEALNVMRNGERIVKCLLEYLESKDKSYQALLSTIILAKCFYVKLWENSPYVSKQLPGIGNVLSSQLANAGKTSFQLLSECDPRELEMIMGKKPPAGNNLLEQIRLLPKYTLKLELFGKTKAKIIISLENALNLNKTCTVNRNSLMYLLVGNTSNDILLYEKYSHSYFIENPDVVKFIDFPEGSLDDIQANFISEDWVGIDCFAKLELVAKPEPLKKNGKTPKSAKKNQNNDQHSDMKYMQTFMEMYMKCKKDKEAKIHSDSNVERSQPKSTTRENNERKKHHSNMKVDKTENDNSALKCATQKQENTFLTPFKQKIREQPKVDELIATNFSFTPKSQLTHKRSLCFDISPSTSSTGPVVKKINTEDKLKSQNKITWRSPLTYSPPVKFSPKIVCNVNVGESDTVLSRASSSVSINTQKVPKNQMNLSNSTLAKSAPFPLSDRAYINSSLDDSEERRNEVLEKVGDLASTSFLEDFGLIPRIKDHKNKIRTPNEYYHHLLSKIPRKETCEQSEQNSFSRNRETKNKNSENMVSSHDTFFTKQHQLNNFTKHQSIEKIKMTEDHLKQESSSRYFNDTFQRSPPIQSRYFTQLSNDCLPQVNIKNVKTPSNYPPQNSQYSSRGIKITDYPSEAKPVKAHTNLFNNPLPKSISQEALNRFDEDDIFNDSVDAVLNNYNIFPFETKDTKTLSSTFSDIDFEDSSLRNVLKRNQDISPDDRPVNLSHTKSLSRLEPGPSPILPPQERTINQNLNFSGLSYQPNFDSSFTRPETYVPPKWYYNQVFPSYNNVEKQIIRNQEILNAERKVPTYGSHVGFQENSFDRSLLGNTSFRRTDDIYSSNRNIGCMHYPNDDYNESYCYLRRTMEKENDPFLIENSQPEFRNPFREFQNRQAGHPQRQLMNSNLNASVPNPEYDSFYRRYSFLPHMEQSYVPPQMQTYPHYPVIQPERSHYYEPPYDKKYLMRKFFTEMNHDEQNPDKFYH